jgi:N-acetyl-anhydromuramyl-L-alanine amidase AmpD
MVKYKDSGKEVSRIQTMLSKIGYDLISDGIFGKMTLNAVKKFQRENNLTIDGVVGENTLKKLESYQNNNKADESLEIHCFDADISCALYEGQYVKEKYKKTQIYIHFTAGSSSAKNAIHGWNSDEPRIATAYIIDGDNGKIYQTFNPDYFAYHLGVSGTSGKMDKCSIGIEICAFGHLKEKNGKFYAWPNDWNKEIKEENVYKLKDEFRGYKYFYSISNKQYECLEDLLCFLIEKYNIKVQNNFDKSWFDYKPELIKSMDDGIWTHVNVRKDKTDMYPDHRLLELLNRLAKKYNK